MFLQQSPHPLARNRNVSLYVWRDDLYSPAPGTALQGNKVRKLAPHLRGIASLAEPPLVVSFGGAYSNHISALATAGRLYGFPVVLFVRGEEADNSLLRRVERDGATLVKISRTEYRRKTDPAWIAARTGELAHRFGRPPEQIIVVPEGGTSPEAIASVGELYQDIENALGSSPDYLCVSAGTGGTAAGLIAAAAVSVRVEVYPALKGGWMRGEIERLLPSPARCTWGCIDDYHFGGYGRFPANWLVAQHGLAKTVRLHPTLPLLEPVYTAKLFAGVSDRIAQGLYSPGSSVVVVHTGGIY